MNAAFASRLGQGFAALALAAVLLFSALTPALAVNPDEVLADPQLEARARAISAELRCLVCQNQSIDDSDADLARDLRLLVRERLSAGDSDSEVYDYVVSRYGEFVLLKPRLSLRTALLWTAPILLLLIGIAVLVLAGRSRQAVAAPPRLDAAEEAEIARLTGKR
ncbi:cytochrome c-type biogenesis protein [Pseudohoeflea coraliihabitans]|uniref:Cytochrome c-type biogenesis protein n=1 Tax=Pseudohoeflea coraliihabitans TaxID=2860393 RepID=A0ABS6WRW8_9HYPH|nr:cytochrome c-type biogenesis protein [Pseudohoeflea sp. DP4N28-3]MBW3098680.1 cytochrome c-type biogenesis protein CcmH [Pseudohoeflea sp. DP4N28-3]